MATVTVEMTDQDIEHGVQSDCRDCPVARAVSRKLRSDLFAGVTATLIRIREKGTFALKCELMAPLIAEEFIEDFDEAVPVDPISFDLDIPGELLLPTAEARNV